VAPDVIDEPSPSLRHDPAVLGARGGLAALALAVPSLADGDWRQLPSPLSSMFSMTVASSESWMAQRSDR
jgi:hypothetical protein